MLLLVLLSLLLLIIIKWIYINPNAGPWQYCSFRQWLWCGFFCFLIKTQHGELYWNNLKHDFRVRHIKVSDKIMPSIFPCLYAWEILLYWIIIHCFSFWSPVSVLRVRILFSQDPVPGPAAQEQWHSRSSSGGTTFFHFWERFCCF